MTPDSTAVDEQANGHAASPPEPGPAAQRPSPPPLPPHDAPAPPHLHEVPSSTGKAVGFAAVGLVVGAIGGFLLGRVTRPRRVPFLGWRRRALVGTVKRTPAVARGTVKTVRTARHPVRRLRG